MSTKKTCPAAGTPLQNNLEELWSLLNILMPSLFNCAEAFTTWFGSPPPGAAGSSQGALSDEEALLVTNRLHQVLRPFVLRRLKQAVASDLPPKVLHPAALNVFSRKLSQSEGTRQGLAHDAALPDKIPSQTLGWHNRVLQR